VVDALTDPDFYPALGALPAIEDPAVVGCERTGDRVELRVRYRFCASLPAAARRVVDIDRLTWVDETVIDLSTSTATFRIVPEHYAGRLSASGRYELLEDGAATVQRLNGEVAVHIRLVGGMAERGIVRGLSENLEQEGRLLERWIADRT
jgi:hypothetical protein